MADSPWRARLRPASYKGVEFHVELGSHSGGRRIAPHEYPKRDDPYPEDMGRKGKNFPVSAYYVGPFYQDGRDALIEALDSEGPGLLIHPTFGEVLAVSGPFTCLERREKGGFCEFEILFFEARGAGNFTVRGATQDRVRTSADAVEKSAVTQGTAGAQADAGVGV